MKKSDKIFPPLGHALATLAYVALVATAMTQGERLAGEIEKSILAPIGFLLLLVSSAAITGFLVFGRPVMLYLDGKKKESVKFLASTIIFLFLITLIVFTTLILK